MARDITIRYVGDASSLVRASALAGASQRKLSRDVEGSHRKMGDSFKGIDKAISGFRSVLTSAVKPTAVGLASAFSAQFTGAVIAGLASGIQHAMQGLGSALALLPAVAGAAGLAVGTLTLAMSGMADTLKAGLTGDTEAFAEGLKGLAPAAQDVAKEIVGLKGGFDSLKDTVQGNLFGPLIGQIRPLGEIYLRQLHLILGPIATGFGQVANQVSNFLQVPTTFRAIFFAMEDMGEAVGNLLLGVGNLVQAFLPLVTVGATFLPGLTDGFGGATAQLAAFMREAERTGALHDFIQRGIDAIKQLIDTGAQLVRIFANIGSVFQGAMGDIGLPAGTLLDTIERLTEKAQAFFATGQGKSVLGNAMGILTGLAESFFGTLQKVGTILAPVLPQIGELLTAFFNLKTGILDALAPAVHFVGKFLLPALTSVLNWLSRNGPVLQGILIALFTLWAVNAGIAAAATIAATWPLILVGVAIAGLAALVIIHFDTIKKVILGVWDWIKNNWPLLIGIITGPIGIVVALLITHWNTIKDTVVSAWTAIRDFFAAIWQSIVDVISAAVDYVLNFLRNNWPLILAILTGPIGLAVLAIQNHWNTIKTGVSTAWEWIKSTVGAAADWVYTKIIGVWNAIKSVGAGIWRSISSAIGSAWDGIKNKVRGAVNFVIGIINGLISGVNWVLSKLGLPTIGKLSTVGGGGNAKGGGTGAVGITPMASGGVVGACTDCATKAAGGFKTAGPQVLVGEGKRQYPEYVIPTDPAYRNNALGLYASLGRNLIPGMQFGGWIGDVVGAGKKWVTDRAKDVAGLASGVFRGALGVGFAPFNAAAKAALSQAPNPFGVRDIAQGLREAIYDWVKGADSGLPTQPPPGAGGARPRGSGLAGLHEPMASIAAAVLRDCGGSVWIGSGWRSKAAQEALRIRNGCPGVYVGSASSCRVPTAIPGSSKHEQGLAVDWGGNIACYQSATRRHGGHFPVSGEHWHAQPIGYQMGGLVARDGPAYLHRGEEVIRRGRRGEPVVVIENLTIHANTEAEGRAASKGFNDVLARRRVMTDARIA